MVGGGDVETGAAAVDVGDEYIGVRVGEFVKNFGAFVGGKVTGVGEGRCAGFFEDALGEFYAACVLREDDSFVAGWCIIEQFVYCFDFRGERGVDIALGKNVLKGEG